MARKKQKQGIQRQQLVLPIIKKAFLVCIALLLCGTVARAQRSYEAKNILRLSREKCQSIKGGHYVMQWKKKYLSDKDTITSRYTCDFKKLPADTVYGKAFAQFEEFDEGGTHYLYTGNEFVWYYDTVGEVMSCDQWADKIIRGRHNRTFYYALTNKTCYPIATEEEMADSSYSYSLSETMLDGRPCHLVDYVKKDFPPDTVFGIIPIRYEVNLWIDKQNYMPIQYTIAVDIVEGQDTQYEYTLSKLLAFDTVLDESHLSLKSIPAEVSLKDYVPYTPPEPLAEGTAAPDWSLPTLTGDTVRLADLKGKVVLIDFFYKSCAPCCAALPTLQSLHEKYKNRDFVMIGIDPYDKPEKDEMADFLSKREVTYTVLFSDYELSKVYHVAGYPTLFFIDRDGKIAKIETGFSKTMEEEIEEQLLKML